MISVLVKLIGFGFGFILITCLVLISIKISHVLWKYMYQALLGSDNQMQPIEFGMAVTGICSIFIILSAPLLNYLYDDTVFITVFGAFCISTGIYAYKKVKENGHTNTEIPKE